MPRLVELPFEEKWKAHAARIMALLKQATDMPVIVADDVAEFFFQSEQERWDLATDFPNLTPPYGLFWVEHKLFNIHSKEKGDTNVRKLVPNGRSGILCITAPVEHVKGENIPAGTNWIYAMEIFIDYGIALDGEIQGPHGTITLAINADGVVLDRPWIQSFTRPGSPSEDLIKTLVTWTHPALLAVSFMNMQIKV